MNPVRFFNEKTVEIKRFTYSGTPKKGSLSTVATVRGYLRTLDETQAAANGFQFGQGFALLVDVNTDLQESDEVIIDGKEYKVGGVATNDRSLSVAHRRAILTLPEAA